MHVPPIPPAVKRRITKLAAKGEHAFHATYLGAVAVEAHGNYRWAALACLVCVLAHAICHEAE